jgi:hypothetical protein
LHEWSFNTCYIIMSEIWPSFQCLKFIFKGQTFITVNKTSILIDDMISSFWPSHTSCAWLKFVLIVPNFWIFSKQEVKSHVQRWTKNMLVNEFNLSTKCLYCNGEPGHVNLPEYRREGCQHFIWPVKVLTCFFLSSFIEETCPRNLEVYPYLIFDLYFKVKPRSWCSF